jgi:hypothetical protein
LAENIELRKELIISVTYSLEEKNVKMCPKFWKNDEKNAQS